MLKGVKSISMKLISFVHETKDEHWSIIQVLIWFCIPFPNFKAFESLIMHLPASKTIRGLRVTFMLKAPFPILNGVVGSNNGVVPPKSYWARKGLPF